MHVGDCDSFVDSKLVGSWHRIVVLALPESDTMVCFTVVLCEADFTGDLIYNYGNTFINCCNSLLSTCIRKPFYSLAANVNSQGSFLVPFKILSYMGDTGSDIICIFYTQDMCSHNITYCSTQ